MSNLGERMKGYENVSRIYLTKRSPVIIRIDGRAFHTFTKGFKRPFDKNFSDIMVQTAKFLCENISGCKLAYVQSDEISLLLTDYDALQTQPWFENNLQKLVSVSASLATLIFNRLFDDMYGLFDQCFGETWKGSDSEWNYRKALQSAWKKGATFDARAFILPKEEVCNYFIWRQQDATRNSILMVAQANFSQKEIEGIKCDALQDKLFKERNINWNDLPIIEKRGCCVVRKEIMTNDNTMRNAWVADYSIPVFTQDKEYINRLVYLENEEK